MSSSSGNVSVEEWIKGITFSILASIIGGASKLAIRKSWLLEFALAAAQEESSSSSSSSTCLLTTSTNAEDDSLHDAALASPSTKLKASPPPYHTHAENNNHTVVAALQIEDSQFHDGLWRNDSDACPAVVVAQEEEVAEEIRRYCCCINASSSSSSTASTTPNTTAKATTSATQQKHWYPWSLRMSGLVGMTFLNPLCCVLAMKYASPSILAPFSGLTLVWIVLLSRVLIGEEPTEKQKMAAAMIVGGEVMVAAFGDHTNDEGVTVDDVERSYAHLPFLLYFVAMFFWMLCLWYWMASEKTHRLLKRFAWGVSGGSITGLQNFLKDALTIGKAKHAATDDDAGWPWFLVLFIFLAVATAFGGLLLLTACMKRYDATYSSAMFVGSFVVSASVMSAVHYDTFQNLGHAWNFIMYPMGLVVLMSGVFTLVHETREHAADDEEEDGANDSAFPILAPNDLQEQLLYPHDDRNESSLL